MSALRLAIVIALLWAIQGQAQDLSPQRLQELNERVRKEKANLQQLVWQQGKLEKKLVELRQQISGIGAKEAALAEELSRLRVQESEAEDAVVAAEARVREVETLSLARVRALYVWGDRQAEVLSGLIRTPSNFSRSAFYLKKVRQADAALIDELAAARSVHESRVEDLRRISQGKEGVIAGLQEQRHLLDLKVREQETVSDELKKRKGAIEKLLTALKAEALRLEVVLRSLLAEASHEKHKRHEQATLAFASPWDEGVGLEARMGTLDWPVGGKLVRRYGDTQSRSFEDYVFANGVQFECDAAGSVHAIAEGRATYTGELAGYGKVVILDHGKHTYSLYGSLGEVSVKPEQMLQAGEVLGNCAAAANGGAARVYLEVRKRSKAVDPLPYFRSVQ